MRIYKKLPDDVQHVIRGHFPIWQSLGFRYEPNVLVPHPKRYFNTIRKCPHGAKWCPCYPTVLYVRRRDHVFQWKIQVHSFDDTEDGWFIEMYPQWNDVKKGLVDRVFTLEPWKHYIPALSINLRTQVD